MVVAVGIERIKEEAVALPQEKQAEDLIEGNNKK